MPHDSLAERAPAARAAGGVRYCRIADVARSYTYTLNCMPLTVAKGRLSVSGSYQRCAAEYAHAVYDESAQIKQYRLVSL